MTQWNEIQEKARKLIDEGMRLLRSGMNDAEYLAEATASAAKLHMTIRKNRIEKYRVLHDMGAQLHGSILAGSAPQGISQELRSLSERVRRLDEEAAAAEGEVAQLTVVRKGQPPTDKPTPQGQ